MRTARGIAGLLWALAAVVMIVVGPALIYRGMSGRSEIRHELTAQKMRFPAAGDPALTKALSGYAGKQVTTGPQARAYADLIEQRILATTRGKTYSEVSALAAKDAKLAQLRTIAAQGEALRTTLLSSYTAWQVTWLAIILGGVLTSLTFVFGATSVALLRDRRPAAPAPSPARAGRSPAAPTPATGEGDSATPAPGEAAQAPGDDGAAQAAGEGDSPSPSAAGEGEAGAESVDSAGIGGR